MADWAINCLMLSILLLSSGIYEMVLHNLPSACTLISVSIVGYAQSKSRAVHMMIQWLPDAKWVPVPLADHPDSCGTWSLQRTQGLGSTFPCSSN